MPELLQTWLASLGLSSLDFLILIFAAGLTSLISAAMGIGGGILLLVIMASIIPLSALIPVHGLVQLGSNANRVVMKYPYLQWSIFGYFFIGALLASGLSLFFIAQLPLSVIQISIGLFVLLMVWGLKPQKRDLPAPLRILAGFVTTLLTMFVGATGPLVAAMIHAQRADRHELVATFAACMTSQHALKIVVFIIVGFAFMQWLPLAALMIASGAIGTWLGLKLLDKLSAKYFDFVFKAIMTTLAIRLLYLGIVSLDIAA